MSGGDKIEKRYERKQEEKRRRDMVTSDDDAPIPDAPVEQARSESEPERNAPCPCGSGKKYKKCCGKPK